MTKDEALKMAIEALLYGTDHTKAVKVCKEALEQPKQEPVLYIDQDGLDGHATWAQATRCQDSDIALYTHPNQWQGLSDKEIILLEVTHVSYEAYDEGEYGTDINIYTKDFARAIEAKLREKNT
jgi:hypothetical protein